jgi:hypothetical protein
MINTGESPGKFNLKFPGIFVFTVKKIFDFPANFCYIRKGDTKTVPKNIFQLQGRSLRDMQPVKLPILTGSCKIAVGNAGRNPGY